MRLRQRYGISDRLKLLLILSLVLMVLIYLACYKSGQEKTATIEELLSTALKPVGTTMYIWGGGWDDADSKAGEGASRLGLSSEWIKFAETQDSDYDFEDYRFQREKGLDCSGYVGWVLYNTFENLETDTSYVMSSTDMAENFASRKWGELLENPEVFLPGDIVSMKGHVWISLGTCKDGSVLLVHSSPPGVSVCGTPARTKVQDSAHAENPDDIHQEVDTVPEETLQEEGSSIAIQLAEEFMSTYYPKWQERYPNRSVGLSYLENVKVMRWNHWKMKDAESFQQMSGEEIFSNISCEE